MLLWWLQAVLPTTLGAGLLAWCCLILWLRFRELFPSLSLAGLTMSILDGKTNVLKLKSRLGEIGEKPTNKVLDRKKLAEALNDRIFGQQSIVEEIVNSIARASLREKRKSPIAKFMIAGPSGKGKSLLGKVLGEELFGRNGWVLLPMASASNSAKAHSVFGVPGGLEGGHRPAPRMIHIINNPDCVIIVDEIEKANEEVRNTFLNAMQEGYLLDPSSGENINVTRTLFIFTTNASAKECAHAGENQTASVQQISKECKQILSASFDPAFMSRIDMVFAFQPLDDFAMCELIASNIIDLVESYPMTLTKIDPEVLAQWAQRYDSKDFDGRDVANDVIEAIGDQLNDLKLRGVQCIEIKQVEGKPTPKAA